MFMCIKCQVELQMGVKYKPMTTSINTCDSKTCVNSLDVMIVTKSVMREERIERLVTILYAFVEYDLRPNLLTNSQPSRAGIELIVTIWGYRENNG